MIVWCSGLMLFLLFGCIGKIVGGSWILILVFIVMYCENYCIVVEVFEGWLVEFVLLIECDFVEFECKVEVVGVLWMLGCVLCW